MELAWGILLAVGVVGVLAAWFRRCGAADQARVLQPFARRTLALAAPVFVLGLAFLNADIGAAEPQGRMGLVATTVGAFLLMYSAGAALTAANDQALRVVNLTGRALLLSDPDLAPFHTLPAPQDVPADTLPPPLPRTYYVVSVPLGRAGAVAGRTDLFTIDAATAFDPGANGPLLVRRLLPAALPPP
ncbi:MAG: hypothetical protein U1F10_08100 [Burkholderiales bacterium]